MAKFKIRWTFDDDKYESIVECDNLEEAEWAASDRLREMVYARTSSSAEELDE